MPKREIDLPYRIEYLSILDENGQLDSALDPHLPDDLLLRLYQGMVLARKFDERMLVLQRQGKIGTFAPTKGQEAQIGAAANLAKDDWLVPSFREAPSEVWRGKSMESVLLYYSGYNEGGRVPEGGRDLPVSVPVGSQPLHAAGIAYTLKYRRTNNVAMTFFGDGATSEGDFHEALNFASVFQVPVVFVCQNNQWAISLPRSRQTHSRTIAQKALAYDMPGLQVDGNDILAVYQAAKEAVDRARQGEGPTFLELITYRLSLHTTADDPTKYRKQEEVKEWEKRDPITRFAKYLTEKGLLTEQKIEEIANRVISDIRSAEEAWSTRTEKGVDPLDMFTHAYSQLPPNLLDQKEELRLELQAKRVQSDQQANVRD
ncbi:MAG: pyruvate dehydrogenase (acetyl-transferring) E1 component subunit alpha [Syntrophobacter sp.]